MSPLARRPAAIAATVAAMLASASTMALAQGAPRTLADNEGILIDGKALTVTPGHARDAIGSLTGNLGVRPLGPGAIVFRSGDKLYMVDGPPMSAAHAMYDPGTDRQRSYGGLYDPYPNSDYRNDRQRSYGGLNDPYPSSDYRNDRQRSYGGLSDPYPSSDYRNDRQRSYGGFYDSGAESRRAPSDRQQSYGGFYDQDYANYQLRKTFSAVWGPIAQN